MATNVDVPRALRDREYYLSLSEEERAQVPEHPAGENELSEEDLESASGGSEVIVDPGTTDCSQDPTRCTTKYTAIYCCG